MSERKIEHKKEMDQLAKELHKPFSKKYPRRKVRAAEIVVDGFSHHGHLQG